jgi:hypothetical protein
MSSDRLTYEQMVELQFEHAIRALKAGKPVMEILGGIVQSAAYWGSQNVLGSKPTPSLNSQIPWSTISDEQLRAYTKSRTGLTKTLAQALLDTREWAGASPEHKLKLEA